MVHDHEKPLSESSIVTPAIADIVLDIDVLSGMNISHRIDVGSHSSISIRARVHRSASFSIFIVGNVERDCTIDRATLVIGDAASIELSSSIRTKGNARCNISDDVDIAANNSRCVIDNRVVAYDTSRAVIRERVVVHQSVNSGNVATTIRGMIIGESASIRAIPELDIATNTVSAKHAVSIARPSAMALAYCASRGIDRENAMVMIADGLLCPMVGSKPNFDDQNPSTSPDIC